MRAEQFIDAGYQRILTFERPTGGFDWWGRGPAITWLTGYGVQQLSATAKVHEIDRAVIDRAYQFLATQQQRDGSWKTGVRAVVDEWEDEFGEEEEEESEEPEDSADPGEDTMASVDNPRLALTAYTTWSLAEAGYQKRPAVKNAISFLRRNWKQAEGNAYLLSLIANAFVYFAPDDDETKKVLNKLIQLAVEKQDQVYWSYRGQTVTGSRGRFADIETTALALNALLVSKLHVKKASKALRFLVDKKSSTGTWGSTQATILALKCLTAGEYLKTKSGSATVDIYLNDEKAHTVNVDDNNRDVMQVVDLSTKIATGDYNVRLQVEGSASVVYQIMQRHYQPWSKGQIAEKNPIAIDIEYDRQTLKKDDTIMATATMRYSGEKPTFMVILDLGIPPGFSIDRGDFAELLGDGKIKRFSVTSRQITLYLGKIEPQQTFVCRYQLKAKYPLRVKTPKSSAYEYYSPNIKADSKPVELIVK